jgi:cobalt transporter subunit CbtB
MTAIANPQTLTLPRRIAAGLVLIVVGAALLYAAGLSHIAAAHDAAHDTRHAIGFPCH